MTQMLLHLGPLEGTLQLPVSRSGDTAVLIVAGSGPTDRDGNSPLGVRAASLALIAAALAEAGIPSLRFDKRGIGASAAGAPPEEDMRFGIYVDDAAAWAQVLRRKTGAARIVILGHSEGALIGTMAAAQVDAAGLIAIAGAGEPADAIILRQMAEAGTPPALLDRCRAILALLRSGGRTDEVPAELAALFRPSVQPYLASWIAIDPAAETARLGCPVLVVQGDRDIQVSIADAERLAAAAADARLVIVQGMNHVLKRAPADRAGNAATYGADDLPLAPGLMEAIVGFVAGRS